MRTAHRPSQTVRNNAICILLLMAMPSTVCNGHPLDDREPITYEHVYGSKRIRSGTPSRSRYTWISDSHFLQREKDEWKLVDAVTGVGESLYDREQLIDALATIDGVSDEEAKRLAAGAWVKLDTKNRRVVFAHDDSLIRVALDGTDIAVVKGLPTERDLLTVSPVFNAVGFVSRNELWVADFATQQVRQLTFDASDTIRNGKADWIYFEEVFDRSWQGYRFSPDGLHIAYQQFNDTNVPTFSVIDHSNVDQSVETENWPQAGDTNPTVRLGVVSATGGDTVWVDSSAYPADDLLITHFNWLPNGKTLYWFAQNRIQTWLELNYSDPTSGTGHKLLKDSNGAWIESPGDLQFLADGSFLMKSDRNGWMHVYRISADGAVVTPVTSGEWEVRKLHCVTEDESAVIVSGTKDSHIAENLYRVALNGSGETERLTPDDGHHSAVVSSHGALFVDRWSNINEPETVTLRDSNGKEVRAISKSDTASVDKYRLGTVELTELPMADGSTTTGIVVYPPDFDAGKKHPVWLMTYGGPHRPTVRNAYRSRMLEHLLANLGIVVVRFDPRSASGYGAKSAWIAYRQLGVEECRDLESLCDWLAEQPWVDSERIGMNGHSYGGYYTAYAMTHTDKLSAGIAGAPVTDWAHYDTIYTERFMSTPQDNPEGYKVSSVVAAADQLHGRLLILHGLKDDNVHPSNSLQFIHELQRANKDFQVMVYPTARHGIFGTHYNRLKYNFIVEAMGIPEARQSAAD
jgi:dipeptidyl-peptidase 4